MHRLRFLSLMLALGVAAWSVTQTAAASSESRPTADLATQRVLVSEVEWGPLNPARGDKGPQAGTLWGDRTAAGPSGFLVDFAEGFSSPPHVHNVAYRGVVIRGLVHNDDPGAEPQWMPAGSFWTQPAGAVHITAAKAARNLAYIEIEDGPYLVHPTVQAFDDGERPVNVDPSNIVWLDASSVTWVDRSEILVPDAGPELAFLWGRPQDDRPSGTLVRLPAGFRGELRSHGSTLRVVQIQGHFEHQAPHETDFESLRPGSYFGSQGEGAHRLSCQATEACVLYVRTTGRFDLVPGDHRTQEMK
ncbi:MAG: DUF4437 domain-containing protein [Acidobacteriota bacterium]